METQWVDWNNGVLSHPDANCMLEPLEGCLKRLTVIPAKSDTFMPRSSVVISYPQELIRKILTVKGPGYLCDEIAREEEPSYIRFSLETDLKAQLSQEKFAPYLSIAVQKRDVHQNPA